MQQRNEGSSKKRTVVLANKIGAIFTSACGIARSPNMAFGFGIPSSATAAISVADDDDEKNFDNGGNAALSNAHPCEQMQVHASTNCIRRLSSQRRPVAFASAILTKKWKTSLKRVKLRIKRDLKMTTTTKTANDEARSEMELCKKRILMGEKCRALNLSGVLHYDKQGILLPED